MDYARILHFRRKLEEFEQIGLPAFVTRDPNEPIPLNVDYSHTQVIDLSSSDSSTSSSSFEVVLMAKGSSHFTEQIVKDSDSNDHTSRMVKYFPSEPSFLDREPSMENDPIYSWKMCKTKSSTGTFEIGIGRSRDERAKTSDDVGNVCKSCQMGGHVPKTILTRFKTLGRKLRDSYSSHRTRRQTSESISTVPVKVAVSSGVSAPVPSENKEGDMPH
ncbi:hypothetical protein ACOSP7_014122 [Xanthoceras sorbifolium]